MLVAEACRIMAHSGLAEDILGHVSVRLNGDDVLVRCRGPQERGLLFTEPSDVHAVRLAAEQQLPGGYQVPNEFPIHEQILLARPDVQAVVHAHPPAVVAADLAGLELRPIVGAYNIPAMRLAASTVPIYPRSILINRTGLGRDLVDVLGGANACILHGHGIVTTGSSVQQAMARALSLDSLARMTLLAHGHHGTTPPVVSEEDIDEMPDLGSAFNDSLLWRHHVARLGMANLSLR